VDAARDPGYWRCHDQRIVTTLSRYLFEVAVEDRSAMQQGPRRCCPAHRSPIQRRRPRAQGTDLARPVVFGATRGT
jgi:hypothetical protein